MSDRRATLVLPIAIHRPRSPHQPLHKDAVNAPRQQTASAGIPKETNYRTEFVAVLANQPQGGFITRKPTVDVLVASDNDGGNDSGFGLFFQRGWGPQAQPQPQPGDPRRRGGQPTPPVQRGWW